MKVVDFTSGSVTLELAPADCLILAAACKAAVDADAAANRQLTETLGAARTLAAIAGAAPFRIVDNDRFTLEGARQEWTPRNDRYVH